MIRQTIRDFITKRRHQRAEDMARIVAACTGKVAEAQLMVAYFSDTVKEVDPHTNWWRFAELKQKHADAKNDHTLLGNKAEEACARMRAYEAKVSS